MESESERRTSQRKTKPIDRFSHSTYKKKHQFDENMAEQSLNRAVVPLPGQKLHSSPVKVSRGADMDQQIAFPQVAGQGPAVPSTRQLAEEDARQASQYAMGLIFENMSAEVSIREQQRQAAQEETMDDPTAASLANPMTYAHGQIVPGEVHPTSRGETSLGVVARPLVTNAPNALAQFDSKVYGVNMSDAAVESRVLNRSKAIPTDSLWWLRDPLKMSSDSVDAQIIRGAMSYREQHPEFDQKNEDAVARELKAFPQYRIYGNSGQQAYRANPSVIKMY